MPLPYFDDHPSAAAPAVALVAGEWEREMGSTGAGEADREPSAPSVPQNVDPFPIGVGVCGIGGSVCCDCDAPLATDDDGCKLRSGGPELLPMVERRRARPREATAAARSLNGE